MIGHMALLQQIQFNQAYRIGPCEAQMHLGKKFKLDDPAVSKLADILGRHDERKKKDPLNVTHPPLFTPPPPPSNQQQPQPQCQSLGAWEDHGRVPGRRRRGIVFVSMLKPFQNRTEKNMAARPLFAGKQLICKWLPNTTVLTSQFRPTENKPKQTYIFVSP